MKLCGYFLIGIVVLFSSNTKADETTNLATSLLSTPSPTSEFSSNSLSTNAAITSLAMRELSEQLAFTQMAVKYGLDEIQQSRKREKALLTATGTASFLASWAAASYWVVVLIGDAISGNNVKNLIRALEASTKLFGAWEIQKLLKSARQTRKIEGSIIGSSVVITNRTAPDNTALEMELTENDAQPEPVSQAESASGGRIYDINKLPPAWKDADSSDICDALDKFEEKFKAVEQQLSQLTIDGTAEENPVQKEAIASDPSLNPGTSAQSFEGRSGSIAEPFKAWIKKSQDQHEQDNLKNEELEQKLIKTEEKLTKTEEKLTKTEEKLAEIQEKLEALARGEDIGAISAKYERIKGNLKELFVLVSSQGFREGGELGILTGVSLVPYASSSNIGAAIGSAGLSAGIGFAPPLAIKLTVELVDAYGNRFQFLQTTGKRLKPHLQKAFILGLELMQWALIQYAVHEIEEILAIDYKPFDLKEYIPGISEKKLPMSVISAFVPYDSDPTVFQFGAIVYPWMKYVIKPAIGKVYKLAGKFWGKLSRCFGYRDSHSFPATSAQPVESI